MAHLIDSAPTLLFVVWIFANPDSIDSSSDGGVGMLMGFFIVVAVMAMVQVVLLATRAQTIGKIVLKIRIVDHSTGAHPGFARVVLMRSFLPLVINGACSYLFGLVDACFIFGAEKRCVHDLMAGTSVVVADWTEEVDASVFD